MSALQGRVFDRFRQYEKLSPELQAQVMSVADALAEAKLYESQAVFRTVVGVKTDKLSEQITKTVADATPEQVKEIIDGLVLKGFFHLDHEKHVPADKLEGFATDKSVFVPTAETESVWSVREGAIQAGTIKRAGKGFLGTVSDSYVLINDKTKALYFFDADFSLSPRDKVELAGASVEFDVTVEFGIKVTNAKSFAIVGAPNKDKQDEWLNSIINAGAVYREAFNVDIESVKSFYELKDFDMNGKEVSMADYEGKVVMVVNVSSNCGLTPTNYPELTALDEKYRDQGLAILAFPCNQFANQEPGTHEEIMEFVKKYNCQFPFFEKHDVNGKDARPVFTYLKAKLPGSFGNFVKWNFTKFLVDRNGQPYKRFAPKDLPFSFEEDIKTLLAQKAGETLAEEPAVEPKTEEAKKEEPKAEEAKVEPKAGEAKEEPKAEEAKKEEPKNEEAKAEEVKTEEVKTAEVKTEVVTEEVKPVTTEEVKPEPSA